MQQLFTKFFLYFLENPEIPHHTCISGEKIFEKARYFAPKKHELAPPPSVVGINFLQAGGKTPPLQWFVFVRAGAYGMPPYGVWCEYCG